MVHLVAHDGRVFSVEVVLDTGFEGQLALPSEVIARAGMSYFDDYTVEMANGLSVTWPGYEGQVLWRGRKRDVLVLESAGELLLGMNLLWRNRLTMDVHANGPITIEELN